MKSLSILALERKLKTAKALVKSQEQILEDIPLDSYGRANAVGRLEASRADVRLISSRLAELKSKQK